MKIQVNYDVLQEVDMANTGFSIKRELSKNIKFAWIPGLLAGAMVYGITKNPTDFLASNLKCPIYYMCFTTLFSKLLYEIPLIKEIAELNAYNNLKKLATDLNVLQVKTNATLLKEASLVQKEYKLKTNDKGLPVVVSNKYIEIPAVYGYGETSSETILQEHIIGTKKYDISIGTPNKELKLKKAYGNT